METILAWLIFICIVSLVGNIILVASYFFAAGRLHELDEK